MNPAEEEWVVFGSSLAALVLTERLGASGRDVTLLNSGRSWGGIFAGLTVNGPVFTAAMTNFEFELFGDRSDVLQEYDPDRKGALVNYVHFVRAYIERFATVHEVPAPHMVLDGTRYPDLIISNQLEGLQALTEDEKQRVVRELENILRNSNPLHPRFKNDARSPLAEVSFSTVSIANHGATFHGKFVEPVFQKVLGVATSEVPGVFHRSGWSPLFYPETLLSQFGPRPQTLKRTVFHYPDDIHFGAFIQRILARVRTMPNVRVIESVTDMRLSPNERLLATTQGKFAFQRLAWAGELRELASQTGGTKLNAEDPVPQMRRSSLELFFLQVRRDGLRDKFSVLIDPDVASPFYRVTDQSICGRQDPELHQVILECNAVHWNRDAQSEEKKLATAYERYGINAAAVQSLTHRSFANALAVPSLEQRELFNSMREMVRGAIPDVQLLGPSSGYSSITLNDHLIQALQVAQQHGALT